jgi:hypothetical protein
MFRDSCRTRQALAHRHIRLRFATSILDITLEHTIGPVRISRAFTAGQPLDRLLKDPTSVDPSTRANTHIL